MLGCVVCSAVGAQVCSEQRRVHALSQSSSDSPADSRLISWQREGRKYGRVAPCKLQNLLRWWIHEYCILKQL